MEGDKGDGGDVTSSVRVSATLALPAPPPPSQPALPQPSSTAPYSKKNNPPPLPSPKSGGGPNKRQQCTVELKEGETTIVSWKKLLRESSSAKGTRNKNLPDSSSVVPDPPLLASSSLAQTSEGEQLQDAPPSNRFSAVIEKIERLYMGKQSSDEEELDDIPDDDQYDTDDSFIDDAELDEYFQVDKLSTKHKGYFVNRGTLERIESSSPNLAPKKRRRKDSTNENETKNEHVVAEVVHTGNVRMKAAARSAPLMGKKLGTPANPSAFDEYYQEGKILKKNLNASAGIYKKSSVDSNINLLNPSVKIPKNVPSVPLESKYLDKRKVGRSLDGETEAEVPSKIRRKERYGMDGLPNVDSGTSGYSLQTAQPSSRRAKEASAIRPKGTTLERSIRDLEKIVALCRPHKLDLVEVDASSQAVKGRLPQEVKQKLAKVARLSASQNKISEEDLIDRLMGIVGHIVQRKTLKRNMREMVESGLTAKQQKADRVHQIKQEVNEIIREHVSLLKSKAAEQQEGSADDFQEVNGNGEKRSLRKNGLDIGMEDKICELYDLYVEGIDEVKGPGSRKLYVELAELWPNGYMDSNGIKDAISRSKERKRSRIYRHKVRDEERMKRKRLASAINWESSLGSPSLSRQERPDTESTTNHVLVPTGKGSY